MKRIILIWILLTASIFAQWSGGTGTKTDPYTIIDADGLQAIQTSISSYFLLSNDIDLEGYDWTPITSLTGGFNGGGYTIHNLTVVDTVTDVLNDVSTFIRYMNRTGTDLDSVLFGYVNFTNVNLTVTTLVNNANDKKIGGIIGEYEETDETAIIPMVTNVKVTCMNITGVGDIQSGNKVFVGGLIGRIDGRQARMHNVGIDTLNMELIRGSYSLGNDAYIGGLVGGIEYQRSNAFAGVNVVQNAYVKNATMRIGNNNAEPMSVGGLFGQLEELMNDTGDSVIVYVKNAFFRGKFTGIGTLPEQRIAFGGITGYCDDITSGGSISTMHDFYNIYSLVDTIENTFRTGQLVGWRGGGTDSLHIVNSYYSGFNTLINTFNPTDTRLSLGAGFIAGCDTSTVVKFPTIETYADTANYVGWDFDSTWTMVSNLPEIAWSNPLPTYSEIAFVSPPTDESNISRLAWTVLEKDSNGYGMVQYAYDIISKADGDSIMFQITSDVLNETWTEYFSSGGATVADTFFAPAPSEYFLTAWSWDAVGDTATNPTFITFVISACDLRMYVPKIDTVGLFAGIIDSISIEYARADTNVSYEVFLMAGDTWEAMDSKLKSSANYSYASMDSADHNTEHWSIGKTWIGDEYQYQYDDSLYNILQNAFLSTNSYRFFKDRDSTRIFNATVRTEPPVVDFPDSTEIVKFSYEEYQDGIRYLEEREKNINDSLYIVVATLRMPTVNAEDTVSIPFIIELAGPDDEVNESGRISNPIPKNTVYCSSCIVVNARKIFIQEDNACGWVHKTVPSYVLEKVFEGAMITSEIITTNTQVVVDTFLISPGVIGYDTVRTYEIPIRRTGASPEGGGTGEWVQTIAWDDYLAGGTCNYDNPPSYTSTYSTLNTVNGCNFMGEAVTSVVTSFTDRYETTAWEVPFTEENPLYVNGYAFFVDVDNNIAYKNTYGQKTIIGRFDGYRYFEVIPASMYDESIGETIAGSLLSIYSEFGSADLIVTKTLTLADGIISRDLPTCGSPYNARYFFIATPIAGGSGEGSDCELDSRNSQNITGEGRDDTGSGFQSRAISNFYTMKLLNVPSVDVIRYKLRGYYPTMLR